MPKNCASTYAATSGALQLQEVAVDWQEPMVPAAQIAAIQLHALIIIIIYTFV